MVLEWKERGHEIEYHQATQNLECISALRNCGLLKFFRTIGLRAQMELLPYFISLWDVDWEIFIIKYQELEIEESEIYFITGLSRRGGRVQLFRSFLGGESTSAMIRRNFLGAGMTRGGKVKITTITNNLPLQTVLFTIAHVSRTQALDESSKSQLQYGVECLTHTVFNWCGGFLANMKSQLTKGKHGNLRQFGFSLILVTFFLEWVPLFWYEWVEVPYPPLRPEASEVESTHVSRRDGSTYALPYIVFYLAAAPITHGGGLCICLHKFPMGSKFTSMTGRTVDWCR